MPKFLLNKLVRRRLPGMYVALNEQAEVKELTGKELEDALVAKMLEEVTELQGRGVGDIGELADVLQLLYDACIATGVSYDDVEQKRREKEAEKDGSVFLSDSGVPTGYYIAGLTCAEDDKWTAYYRKEPERFPEIEE